ncbi:MAG: nucleotidyltransferase domain-containing protein [Nanoarchaeota archaeon]|nr:nucleotidyltransferase domain-containing protein [Nanoarchaeota archaeon]
MFLDILLGSKATWRILVLMSESPGARLTRPEIKRLTHLGNNSITESLKDLVVHDIIDMRKGGRMTYGFNLANDFVKQIIFLCEMEKRKLNSLPYSYSIVLREYVRMVLSLCMPERIVLFGSVAKRIYREDSDIDVALVFKEELPVQAKLDIEDIADRLKKRFGKDIQQHMFTAKEFGSKDRMVSEIKKNGVDLL